MVENSSPMGATNLVPRPLQSRKKTTFSSSEFVKPGAGSGYNEGTERNSRWNYKKNTEPKMRERGKCAQNTKGKKEVFFFNFRLFLRHATEGKTKFFPFHAESMVK